MSNRISQTGQNTDGEAQMVDAWMQKFAGQTPPQNLPAPGLLIFKARLIEKQNAAARAAQPIVWGQIASVVIFAAGIGWLLLKSRASFGALMKETLFSLSTVAPLLILGVATAVLICAAFAYFLRRTQELKK